MFNYITINIVLLCIFLLINTLNSVLQVVLLLCQFFFNLIFVTLMVRLHQTHRFES